MTLLSRIGSAVLILALAVAAVAFTLGVFPRTILGTLVLIIIGFPMCLVGETLAEVTFSRRPRAWYSRAAGVIGVILMVALLWWLWASYAPFVHRNFFG